MPPAASVRISTCRPGRRPGRWSGSCASAARTTVMWSAAVFEPALPLLQQHRQRLPGARPGRGRRTPRADGSRTRVLNVGAACSFSECAVTSVASTSIDQRRLRRRRRGRGRAAPASCHARARAAARAVSIAASAAGASAASASIVRDTVGSEATGPNTPGSDRSSAMSARQSPPSASVTARSSTTLAGSCTAMRLTPRRQRRRQRLVQPDPADQSRSAAPRRRATPPRPPPTSTRDAGRTRYACFT